MIRLPDRSKKHKLKITINNLTRNVDLCLPGLVESLQLNSASEHVGVCLLYGHLASHSVASVRVFVCLCDISMEELSLTLPPLQLRFWVPAFGHALENHPSVVNSQDGYIWYRNHAYSDRHATIREIRNLSTLTYSLFYLTYQH